MSFPLPQNQSGSSNAPTSFQRFGSKVWQRAKDFIHKGMNEPAPVAADKNKILQRQPYKPSNVWLRRLGYSAIFVAGCAMNYFIDEKEIAERHQELTGLEIKRDKNAQNKLADGCATLEIWDWAEDKKLEKSFLLVSEKKLEATIMDVGKTQLDRGNPNAFQELQLSENLQEYLTYMRFSPLGGVESYPDMDFLKRKSNGSTRGFSFTIPVLVSLSSIFPEAKIENGGYISFDLNRALNSTGFSVPLKRNNTHSTQAKQDVLREYAVNAKAIAGMEITEKQLSEYTETSEIKGLEIKPKWYKNIP